MNKSHSYYTADDIREIGEAFVNCTLPKARWTHNAHLVVTAYLFLERDDVDPETDLPDMIRRYNTSTNTPNSDTEGYHETITQLYLAAIKRFISNHYTGQTLDRFCQDLIFSDIGSEDFMFEYYSKEVIFSVKARRGFVAPDRQPASFMDN